jgi:hypothetical protein
MWSRHELSRRSFLGGVFGPDELTEVWAAATSN